MRCIALFGLVYSISVFDHANLPFVRTALSTMPLLWELGQWNDALLFPWADQKGKKRGGVRIYGFFSDPRNNNILCITYVIMLFCSKKNLRCN